MAFKIDSESK